MKRDSSLEEKETVSDWVRDDKEMKTVEGDKAKGTEAHLSINSELTPNAAARLSSVKLR